MENINAYKCPNCGGNISFDASSQNLKCPYCDTEIDIASLKEYVENKELDNSNNFGWEEVDFSDVIKDSETDLEHYVCESCGGEIIGDASMASSMCPYCGNNVIVKKQFEGMLRPEYIVPFKFTYEQAKESLLKHFKGKVLLPNDFKDKNKLEKLIGIYVPYWLFNCVANGGIRYHATRIRHYTRGDYRYTETSHYHLYREGVMEFEKVPVDASIKLDDTMMESLEPYNLKETIDFNTAYLQGYLSDRFELKPDSVKNRANERIKNSMVEELTKTTMGYNSVIPEGIHLSFDDGKVNYAMLPVYILHTKYHDKDYTFAMNGQTGKFVGDLPIDYTKLFLIMFAVFAISFGIIFILAYFVM